MENFKSSSSDESMRRRVSSSNDSVLSEKSAIISSNNNSPLVQCAPPVTWTNVGDLSSAQSLSTTTDYTTTNPAVILTQTQREVLETTV